MSAAYALTRRRALWMGLLAFLPALLFGLMFVAFFGFAFSEAMRHPAPHHEPPAFLFLLFPVYCVVMATWVTSLVLYVVDVFRNPHVPENLRPLWALLFFFMHLVTVPVYWFLYLWQPLRTAGAASGPPA